MSRLFILSTAAASAAALCAWSAAAMPSAAAQGRTARPRPITQRDVMLTPCGIAWGRNARFKRREDGEADAA